MKKIINILIIAFISIISITSINAMGTLSNSESIILNWEKVWTWSQINFYPENNNIIYFWARTWNRLEDGSPEQKYFQIKNWELQEINEIDIISNNKETDYVQVEDALKKHFKQENHDDYTTTLYIDWKDIWTFNYDYININHLSEKAFWYKMGNFEDWKWNDYYYLYTYFNQEKKEIKSNPQIDELLNKVFLQVDKKWEEKSKIIYDALITKIDKLLAKNNISNKKRDLYEYIKYKVEEKIKM